MYKVPLDDLRFAMRVNGELESVLELPSAKQAELEIDTVDAILEEAAKFAEGEWAESNAKGDVNGARWENGKVFNDPSFKKCYDEYFEAGWGSLRMPTEYGGQGLPSTIASACEEMWYAGNLSLSLLPLLSEGAVSAIMAHGSKEIQEKFIPKMVEGVWSGTMNLTEPQAGSDLSQVSSKAVKEGDVYKITGQKIFITWGEQEITENIIHLVLARLPGAPAGTKGISLFVVPKFKIKDDGSLGEANGVSCNSIEHKLGIHGSATCVMQFEDAEGYLIGQENKGLMCMFTMMNNARLGVGLEGQAVADRAFQLARDYSRERIQSRDIAGKFDKAVAIIHHPDVRRMLLVQKATIEAQRALCLKASQYLDKARDLEGDEQKLYQSKIDFMIPIVKAFCTENGVTLTNMAMQVFGGMGFVEETGAAQFVRDVRITPIYEGTNGIQALDFIGRKTAMNKGEVAKSFLEEAGKNIAAVPADMGAKLKEAIGVATEAATKLLGFYQENVEKAATGSLPYLMLFSTVLGASEMAKAYGAAKKALDSGDETFSKKFYENKLQTVKVYFDYVLPNIHSYLRQVTEGADSILAVNVDDI